MILAVDQKARCAYLRYLDDVLDSSFGEAVTTSRDEYVRAYYALPTIVQRSGHLAWKRALRMKLDVVLSEECPRVDPTCCDVEADAP